MPDSRFLRSIPLFSDLGPVELKNVRSVLSEFTAPADTSLFNEGDTGDTLYIVKKGKIAISIKAGDGKSIDIAQFARGEFFGEMSIFDNAPRSATCYTKVESHLICLKSTDFYGLLEKYPQTAIKMMRSMLRITCGRLKKTGTLLSDMVQWGDEARKRAVTDDFTGLYNRRFLDSALTSMILESKKNGQGFALVMVDIDHFGDINKEFGEKTADRVLLEVAPVFRNTFSAKDILARYGGDEFTFILPEREPHRARELCSDLCDSIRKMDILMPEGEKPPQVTLSIGIAAYPQHGTNEKSLKETADQALYKAKEAGRDRAVLPE